MRSVSLDRLALLALAAGLALAQLGCGPAYYQVHPWRQPARATPPLDPVTPPLAPAAVRGTKVALVRVDWHVAGRERGEYSRSKAETYQAAIERALVNAGFFLGDRNLGASSGVARIEVSVTEPENWADPHVWDVRVVRDAMTVGAFQMLTEQRVRNGSAVLNDTHSDVVRRNSDLLVTKLLDTMAFVPRNAVPEMDVSERAPVVARVPSAARPAPAWKTRVAAKANAPLRVAVLEFRGALEPQLLAALADEARSAALDAMRSANAAVMTRESMAAVLKDMGRGGECTEGECEVETARNIGADLVVTGEVLQIQGVYTTSLKLHETRSGSLIASNRLSVQQPLELLEGMKPAAAKLFE